MAEKLNSAEADLENSQQKLKQTRSTLTKLKIQHRNKYCSIDEFGKKVKTTSTEMDNSSVGSGKNLGDNLNKNPQRFWNIYSLLWLELLRRTAELSIGTVRDTCMRNNNFFTLSNNPE